MISADRNNAPGLTGRGIMACLLGMLGMGMLIQYSDVIVGVAFASEHTLALPAIWMLALLSALSGVIFLLRRSRLLSRAEMLCVVFCMLISAPLMTQGFWHRFVAIVATNPRAGDFEKLDAMNDRLWPHGPELLGTALSPGNAALSSSGDCRWELIEYDAGCRATLPVLVNSNREASACVRLRLPVSHDGGPGVVPAEPYIVSVLARATDLGPRSRYACRVYADDAREFTELFSSTQAPKVNFLHRTGFRRVGAYGVRFPDRAQHCYTLEFTLQGNGRVELALPKLFNVAALESIYKGRVLVTEQEHAAMTPAERAGTVVKPDRMWSLRGVEFLLSGYIPVRAWAGPVLLWTLFVLLYLSAILAINIILRRQWLDNERFLLPMSRIPAALIGEDGDDSTRAMASIWTNRMMHLGFAVALAWMMLKVWHFYNPRVPDPGIRVALGQYFTDPSWGKMWDGWRFEVDGIFLSMCLFMELNVLLSLVVGYVLFRSQLWVGELTDLTLDKRFPYVDAQAMGAYLGYALILLVLARKYLRDTLRRAWHGERGHPSGEALSYRGAYLLLLGAIAVSMAWAYALGIPVGSQLCFFVALVAIGVVAARLRAECGTPWGYFGPANLAIILGVAGGVWRFGAEAMIFCYLASFMLGPTCFCLIPGAQMELLGLGRRWQVTPRHLVWCAVLGILGGMLIGGWVFLSNAYALGGDTLHYQWAVSPKSGFFNAYNLDLAAANAHLQMHTATGVPDPSWMVMSLSGAVAIGLTILRQCFAGFWFHPIGFVLGSTNFMDYIWGSALTAWVVRSLVLRLGGTATVRDRLHPLAAGLFLGTCAGYAVVVMLSAYLRSVGVEAVYPTLTP